MRVFETNPIPYGPIKVNFVDENNVVLGYSMDADCCEYFGWYLAEAPDTTIPNPEGLEEKQKIEPPWGGWEFDPSFFEEGYEQTNVHSDGEGYKAIFRIVRKKRPDTYGGCHHKPDTLPLVRYLILFNCQNGYYDHGFKLTQEDPIVLKEGKL